MAKAQVSQVERVTEFLAAHPGKRSITASMAASRYGIANLRSVMTKIRSRVSQWKSGNWEIVADKTRANTTRYTLVCSGK